MDPLGGVPFDYAHITDTEIDHPSISTELKGTSRLPENESPDSVNEASSYHGADETNPIAFSDCNKREREKGAEHEEG